jgi:GxxExxY protein
MGLIEHATNAVSDKVIGAAIEVHRHLGPGLLESTYHACLCRELELRGIGYDTEVPLPLDYKGLQLERSYIVDLVVEDSVMVELKTVDTLLRIHSSQLLTYMRLRRARSGLLLNFNVALLQDGIKRLLL